MLYLKRMSTKKRESIREVLIDIRNRLKWFFSVDGVVVTLFVLIVAALGAFIIQDRIQRQRYLELLELEIRENMLKIQSETKFYHDSGVIYNHTPYSTDVYQAGLQSGYLLTIDPNVQAQLFALYDAYIPAMNKIENRQDEIMYSYSNNWEHCVVDNSQTNDGKDHCAKEKALKDYAFKTYSKFLNDEASQVAGIIEKINFNPTQERLHSFLLRFLMGDKRLKVQE